MHIPTNYDICYKFHGEISANPPRACSQLSLVPVIRRSTEPDQVLVVIWLKSPLFSMRDG